MTFDEQLSRAADSLTARLRDEIAEHFRTITADVTALAQADREHAAAQARSNAERAAAEKLTTAVIEAEARAFAFGQDAGVQEGRTAAIHDAEQDVARLIDHLRALDGASGLSSILEALLLCTLAEAARAAVLLVRGDRAQVWRWTGFGPTPRPSDDIEFLLAGDELVSVAAKNNSVAAVDGHAPSRVPAFAESDWAECVAVPIAVAGEVVAVLYADRNDTTARGWRRRVEVLTRHASRCLEGVLAFRAARMLAAPASHGQTATTAEPTSADDEAAARRYARLLVSEIRLYHEDAVAAGQREGDLATRLGGEIARARMLFEQRIAPRIRQRADYFHDELVRTLANGDPALLQLRS
jgi:hypothetical protein